MAERTTVVLAPGLLCDERLWEPQRRALSDVADILIPDFTTQSSIGEMARSILDAAPERFSLAGLSMGGYVALEIMATAPERVERLALLDTRAEPDTPERRAAREQSLEMVEQGQFQGVTRRLLPTLIHESRLRDERLTGIVAAMAKRVGRDGFVRQTRAIMGRRDFRPYLPTIRCPTVVICGREDALTPLAESEAIAAAIPGARLVVIEECGHLSTLEQPEAVNRELRDWLGVGGAAREA